MERTGRIGIQLPLTNTLYKTVETTRLNNGYSRAYVMRIGLRMFCEASHEERVAVAKEFNKDKGK